MDGIHVLIRIGVGWLSNDLFEVGGGHASDATVKFVCIELAQLAFVTILQGFASIIRSQRDIAELSVNQEQSIKTFKLVTMLNLFFILAVKQHAGMLSLGKTLIREHSSFLP